MLRGIKLHKLLVSKSSQCLVPDILFVLDLVILLTSFAINCPLSFLSVRLPECSLFTQPTFYTMYILELWVKSEQLGLDGGLKVPTL